MGLAMAEHYNIRSNHKKGNAQKLKVKTLLKSTDLPSVEEVRKGRKSWRERLQSPFEKSLEKLGDTQVLADWEYYIDGEPLITKESDETHTADFKSFEDWLNAVVFFTLKDAPDHTQWQDEEPPQINS